MQEVLHSELRQPEEALEVGLGQAVGHLRLQVPKRHRSTAALQRVDVRLVYLATREGSSVCYVLHKGTVLSNSCGMLRTFGLSLSRLVGIYEHQNTILAVLCKACGG